MKNDFTIKDAFLLEVQATLESDYGLNEKTAKNLTDFSTSVSQYADIAEKTNNLDYKNVEQACKDAMKVHERYRA